jgi:hypothetical protein
MFRSSSVTFVSLLVVLSGCALTPDAVDTASTDSNIRAAKAGLGKTCGNGVFGTPKIDCAKGLVCDFGTNGTAPRGPAGSSSGSTGICAKPLVLAAEGEQCGNGVFGTPKIDCEEGLVCAFGPNGTTPRGPAGSSSGSTGTCAKFTAR